MKRPSSDLSLFCAFVRLVFGSCLLAISGFPKWRWLSGEEKTQRLWETFRRQAAWLCGDEAQARRAADEIWRIAVQIWQQRRQQQIKDASTGGALAKVTHLAIFENLGCISSSCLNSLKDLF